MAQLYCVIETVSVLMEAQRPETWVQQQKAGACIGHA